MPPSNKVTPKRFVRKPFTVDAVQVTSDNIEAVAKWCGGDIRKGKPDHDIEEGLVGERFIKVRVYRPMGDRQSMAFAGDWVLYAGRGYKVYTNLAFEKTFEEVVDTVVHRDAGSGRYVSEEAAIASPGTTVKESGSRVVANRAVIADPIGHQET